MYFIKISLYIIISQYNLSFIRQEFNDAIRHLLELTGPQADALGLSPHLEGVERMLREGNGAQQQARAHKEGASLHDAFAEMVSRARASSLDPHTTTQEEPA